MTRLKFPRQVVVLTLTLLALFSAGPVFAASVLYLGDSTQVIELDTGFNVKGLFVLDPSLGTLTEIAAEPSGHVYVTTTANRLFDLSD